MGDLVLINAINTRVKSVLETGESLTVRYDDDNRENPTIDTIWVDAKIIIADDYISDVGGLNTYRTTGMLRLTIHTPISIGLATSAGIADVIKARNTGFKSVTDTGVRFLVPKTQKPIYSEKETLYIVNCEFDYDVSE